MTNTRDACIDNLGVDATRREGVGLDQSQPSPHVGVATPRRDGGEMRPSPVTLASLGLAFERARRRGRDLRSIRRTQGIDGSRVSLRRCQRSVLVGLTGLHAWWGTETQAAVIDVRTETGRQPNPNVLVADATIPVSRRIAD